MTREEAINYVKANLLDEKNHIEALETLIPELKEFDDEKITKWLIGYFNQYTLDGMPITFSNGLNVKDIIAWIEKQDKIDKDSYEIAEKEKSDFVNGQFIECRKSFDEFKEDNSYWLEYVGNDTYIGRSDNILNKKFHITPRQLYSLFTQQHCPKENNANEETNGPTDYGKYVDERINEAAKHFFSEGEDKYSVADLFYDGVRCGKSWFEKQGKLNTFELPKTPIEDTVEVSSRMKYISDDLKPIAEFIMDYANWNLHKDEWGSPTLEVPVYRVLDALMQRGKPYCCG